MESTCACDLRLVQQPPLRERVHPAFLLATPGGDQAFLRRIVTTYLRHECSEYDDMLFEAYGKVGFKKALKIIRRKVSRAIQERISRTSRGVASSKRLAGTLIGESYRSLRFNGFNQGRRSKSRPLGPSTCQRHRLRGWQAAECGRQPR